MMKFVFKSDCDLSKYGKPVVDALGMFALNHVVVIVRSDWLLDCYKLRFQNLKKQSLLRWRYSYKTIKKYTSNDFIGRFSKPLRSITFFLLSRANSERKWWRVRHHKRRIYKWPFVVGESDVEVQKNFIFTQDIARF